MSDSKKKNPNKLIIAIIMLACILSAAFASYSFIKATQYKQLPLLGSVKHFNLIDEQGLDFGLTNLKGKVWIADFFFTSCSDTCPLMTKNMADLSRTFDQVKGVKMVSITVNPEIDSPEVLQAYKNKLHKGVDNWHFLTGERQRIREVVVDSFKLGKVDEPIFHSSYFPLVDRNGNIRGYYDGTKQEEINKLFKDATQLVKERF